MNPEEKLRQERNIRFERITEWMFRCVNTLTDSLWAEFKQELDAYNIEKYEPAQRGARLTAAIKNFKTRRMTDFVINVVVRSCVDEFDITPLTIRKLSKGLFDGRSGSQQNLVQLFGVEGRTRKASARTHELIDLLIVQYRKQAKQLMTITERDIETVKARYRSSI